MYFVFLKNVLAHKMSHRIVPLPTSTSNGIQAFLAHGLRIDFCYLDASHANPDVYLDLIGVWTLLNSGGVVACDDYDAVQAVREAVDAFVKSHGHEIEQHVNSSTGQYWIYKK